MTETPEASPRSEAATPPMGPHTWDDFVALEEDDRRELIDGELVEVEVPTPIHEYIVTMLSYFLMAWARPRKAGYALGSGYKVRISERRGVMPDVQFYRTGNPASVAGSEALTDGRPDLAVEIVCKSSRRYDRVTKLRYYASIGVPEYWIVDPAARTFERLVLQGETYVIAEVGADADVMRPASFEGMEIPLAELWTTPGQGVP